MAETELRAATGERRVAAGGWRRAVVGLLVGAAAGALVALVLPRDDGPRRRDLTLGLPAELRSRAP